MSGAEMIARERARQIKQEGFTLEHDDAHTHDELTSAAISYAQPARAHQMWPWNWSDFKDRGDVVRNLVKAGALIAAEIDRLLRIQTKGK